jgi:hypothetical protein
MLEMREEAAIPGGKGVKIIVREALEAYGGPFTVADSYTGPKPIVLCLLLDPHWFLPHRVATDCRRGLMAPGKVDVADPKLRLGAFISRTLWSWPGCLEEVVPSVYYIVYATDK